MHSSHTTNPSSQEKGSALGKAINIYHNTSKDVKKQSRETQNLTAAVTWTIILDRIRAKQQPQASFLQLGMLCKNTSLPLSLEETFLYGTLGRNDLILVSILFYIFISLFPVTVSYSYIPLLCGTHTWQAHGHTQSHFLRLLTIHVTLIYFSSFPTNQPPQSHCTSWCLCLNPP